MIKLIPQARKCELAKEVEQCTMTKFPRCASYTCVRAMPHIIYLFFFSMTDIHHTTISQPMISKMWITFADDWWKKQWFWGGSIKSKCNTLFPKWVIFWDHANTWLLHNKSAKLATNYQKINIFCGWYFLNVWLFCIITLLFCQKTAKFVTNCRNMNFSCSYFLNVLLFHQKSEIFFFNF